MGTGSEADYLGRDVKGKAVFFASEPLPGSWRHTGTADNAVRLAEQKGAAAIFIVIQLPGNVRTQLYPTNIVRVARQPCGERGDDETESVYQAGAHTTGTASPVDAPV